MKLSRKVYHGPRKNPLNFGADPPGDIIRGLLGLGRGMHTNECYSSFVISSHRGVAYLTLDFLRFLGHFVGLSVHKLHQGLAS